MFFAHWSSGIGGRLSASSSSSDGARLGALESSVVSSSMEGW
jgi:hypothetical protein